MWKGKDSQFPFIDSHMKNYNVRDGSDWELTLKPRLHERLRKSKNIVLFLSDATKNSRALNEEITYGVNHCHLPIIVVYPDYRDYRDIVNNGYFTQAAMSLWSRLPVLRDSMDLIASVHVPLNKGCIERALSAREYTVQADPRAGKYLVQ